MTSMKKLLIAFTVLGSSAAVQAETTNFAGLTYGQTSNKISSSRLLDENIGRTDTAAIIDKDSTVGLRIGRQSNESRYYVTYDNVSGSNRDDLKLRQENLLGSYDVFLPVTQSTKLFGGASAGLTKLSVETSGASRDSNIGYTVGAQLGVLQQVTTNASVELGYRYLRTNASVALSGHGESKAGSLKLDSSAQTYLAANYAF